ncbi:hypothetical protein DBV15_07109 [Temnothorax longispinosus]|uniref:Uncharacterized protein n=1 Tax=Temnothorax longispinosus TaxID=300112 RepID=A0A4S2KWJ8_9HYME|nr:hypothetical protein DBV15_07109 [Temnothorax longispinosus]
MAKRKWGESTPRCCLSLKLQCERIYMPVPPVLARRTRSFIYLRHLALGKGRRQFQEAGPEPLVVTICSTGALEPPEACTPQTLSGFNAELDPCSRVFGLHCAYSSNGGRGDEKEPAATKRSHFEVLSRESTMDPKVVGDTCTTTGARDHPQYPCDEGTNARHLRRVLRNLCGRLAVGQHSRRIKIPCRTCRASRIAEVFAGAAKVLDSLFSSLLGVSANLGRKVAPSRSKTQVCGTTVKKYQGELFGGEMCIGIFSAAGMSAARR